MKQKMDNWENDIGCSSEKIIELLKSIEVRLEIIAIFLLALIILMLISLAEVHAADPWTRGEKWMFGYFTALNIIDMGQTCTIYDSSRYNESFFLATIVLEDKRENAKYVPLMFVATNLSCLGIAHLLPSEWHWAKPRQWFLNGITVFELYAAGRNMCYGVKWRFPF